MSAPAQETTPAPDSSLEPPARRPSRRGFWLWCLAAFIMFSAYAYQKRTGPTYPLRGSYASGGENHRYKLIRSEETTRDARVVLPAAEGVSATLSYKRYKTADAFTQIPLKSDGADLVADLPRQPAAGKLEYFVDIQTSDGTTRVPADASDNIIIRFKDPVPGFILWPHVTMMFFSILFGVRAGLSALGQPSTMRRWAWIALAGMTLGGMVLGPFVQKFAFGEYWTGFPWGYDLTDNKMLIMWVTWLLACSIIGFQPRPKDGLARGVLVVATLVMFGVYLIPHSLRGSELDYSKLEQGANPVDAIGTGD